MEALVIAAPEQGLHTKTMEARVYHTTQDPRCGLYKDAPETVLHINSGVYDAGMIYMEFHNHAAGMMYRNIFANYRLVVPRWDYQWSRWEMPPRVDEPGSCGISKTSLIN